MELQYIKEFVKLAENRNFGRASDELFISQSSLSKHIQSLEKELDGKLFNRSTRSIELSSFGKAFLPYAKKYVELSGECDEAMAKQKRMQSSSFTIGVVRNLQYYNAIKFMRAFIEKYPGTRINAIEMDEGELSDQFLQKKLNLITAAFPLKYTSESHFIPIATGHMVAVMSDTHPLFSKSVISIQDLENEPLIIPEHDAMFSELIKNAFKKESVSTNIIYEGSSAGSLEFAKAGMGISIQSAELVYGQNNKTLKPKDIVPYLSYHYGLLYHDTESLTTWEKRFVDFVRESLEDPSQTIL